MSKTGKNTVYQQYVRNTLWHMFLDGVGEFTVDEFAVLAELKVTGNLRRQLHYAVSDNILQYVIGERKANDRRQYYRFSNTFLKMRENRK